ADEGAVLHAGHVVGIGPREIAVGPLCGIEPAHRAGIDHLLAEPVVLLLRSVGPHDTGRTGAGGDRADPGDDRLGPDVVGRIDGDTAGRGVNGTVHWCLSMIEIVGRTDRFGRTRFEPAACIAPCVLAGPPWQAAASNRSRMRAPCTALYSVVAADADRSA